MKLIYPVLVLFIISGCKKESVEIEAIATMKVNIVKTWKFDSTFVAKPTYSGVISCLPGNTTFSFEKNGTFHSTTKRVDTDFCTMSASTCSSIWTIPNSKSLKIANRGCVFGNYLEFEIIKLTADTMRLQTTEGDLVYEHIFTPN